MKGLQWHQKGIILLVLLIVIDVTIAFIPGDGNTRKTLLTTSYNANRSIRKSTNTFVLATATASQGELENTGGPETKPFNPGPMVTFGSSGLKLNIYGAYYGFVSIFLGFAWYAGLVMCQLSRFLTRSKVDKMLRVPVAISHIWGYAVMRLTGNFPKISGRENLEGLFKNEDGSKRGAMFVANHCSWMDIPFVVLAMGWRNYKMVAKKSLLKVPILSKSISVSGHITIDRSNRVSQLKTFKTGISWLEQGACLVTFPEGTRSKTGRMGPFKKGAFKMAQRVKSPIIPLSIKYAHLINPPDTVFPWRPGQSIPIEIIIGRPIETEGKSDDEVVEQVVAEIAKNLPDCQKPLVGTPISS